jgi:hypothetical protein
MGWSCWRVVYWYYRFFSLIYIIEKKENIPKIVGKKKSKFLL